MEEEDHYEDGDVQARVEFQGYVLKKIGSLDAIAIILKDSPAVYVMAPNMHGNMMERT